MNTIHYSRRAELTPGKFVIPFSCPELAELGIDTLVSSRDRSDAENKVLHTFWDRITLALQEKGYDVEMVNFRNMSITARKV